MASLPVASASGRLKVSSSESGINERWMPRAGANCRPDAPGAVQRAPWLDDAQSYPGPTAGRRTGYSGKRDPITSTLMRGKSHITAALRWLAPAIAASACVLLLLHVTGACVSRPLDTAKAARLAGHAGPPLESPILKRQRWFANTRPVSQGSTDAGGSNHDTFLTPQSEPAPTGVWFPLHSADVQQHRGRAPPSSLPIS